LEEGKYINISDANSGVFNVVLNAPRGLDEKTQYSLPIFLVSEEQHGTDYVVLSKEISLEVDREYYAPEIVASDVSQQISFTQDSEFGLVLNNNYSPLSITLSDKDNSLIKQVKLQVIDAAEGDKFILPEGGAGFELDASVNGELIIMANQGKTVTDFNSFLKELSFAPQPVFNEQSDIIKQLSVEVIDEFDFSSTDLFTSTTLYLEQEFKVDLSIDSVTKVDDYTFSFDAAVDHTVEEEFISVLITSSNQGLSLSQGVELTESKWNLTVAELNNVVVVSDSPINEDVELTFEVSYQKEPDLNLTTVDIVHFPTSPNTQVVSQQNVSDTFYYKAGMENAVYNGKEGDSELILKGVGEINSENGWHLVTTGDASYSIDSANQHINFGESTSGFIEFDNGNEILFTDIEKVSWIS